MKLHLQGSFKKFVTNTLQMDDKKIIAIASLVNIICRYNIAQLMIRPHLTTI